MRATRFWPIVAVLAFLVAGCGGSGGKSSESGDETEAACTKPALEAPNLPRGWPQLEDVTYTQQAQQGPTTVVEGYFAGDVEAAHDDFKRELEEDDSEVSWQGEGRSGQVALRNECGSDDKVFVHITNRPG